jgi:hypothetical protein
VAPAQARVPARAAAVPRRWVPRAASRITAATSAAATVVVAAAAPAAGRTTFPSNCYLDGHVDVKRAADLPEDHAAFAFFTDSFGVRDPGVTFGTASDLPNPLLCLTRPPLREHRGAASFSLKHVACTHL